MPNVVIVSGSPNASSRLNGVVRHFETRLGLHGVFGGRIQVAALPAEALVHTQVDNPQIVEAAGLVAGADAVIFASPVYKASYTGLLKTFIDTLPQKALAGKLVAPVLLGGTISHVLAVEYAFKPVLAALGARRFTAGVYAVDSHVTRTEADGEPAFELHEELRERLDAVVAELLEGLEAKVYA